MFRFRPLVLAAFATALSVLAPIDSNAQGVDRYEFLRMEKDLEKIQGELTRLRNAVDGADQFQRFQQVEGEIQRLTAAVERLGNRLRKHEADTKLKLEDFEFRIIVLEGGDPSVLFQDETDNSANQGALQGGTLGQLTTSSNGDDLPGRADYDAGVSAVQAGRLEEGQSRLTVFIGSHPDSPLAGEASYWLGESHLAAGDFSSAATRFLDAVTLYPSNPRAADAMVKLGGTLVRLGKLREACSTYREVPARYPSNAGAVAQAAAEASRSGC
ncbi:MAG: tol-pal system protein YbgF [Pikeienuella sp.]